MEPTLSPTLRDKNDETKNDNDDYDGTITVNAINAVVAAVFIAAVARIPFACMHASTRSWTNWFGSSTMYDIVELEPMVRFVDSRSFFDNRD